MRKRVERNAMLGRHGVRYSWEYWAAIVAMFAFLIVDIFDDGAIWNYAVIVFINLRRVPRRRRTNLRRAPRSWTAMRQSSAPLASACVWSGSAGRPPRGTPQGVASESQGRLRILSRPWLTSARSRR
jgi:hypothetical protein